jgi:hypothetical protein
LRSSTSAWVARSSLSAAPGPPVSARGTRSPPRPCHRVPPRSQSRGDAHGRSTS